MTLELIGKWKCFASVSSAVKVSAQVEIIDIVSKCTHVTISVTRLWLLSATARHLQITTQLCELTHNKSTTAT